MRRSNSIAVFAALSTSVVARVPAQSSSSSNVPSIPHPYWWEGPSTESLKDSAFETNSPVPLPSLPPLEDEPCESDLSTFIPTPTPQPEPQYETSTVIIHTPSPATMSGDVPSHAPSITGNSSPSDSYYVAPIPLPTSLQLPASSVIIVVPSSSPEAASPPNLTSAAAGYATTPVPVPSVVRTVSWSPSNSFNVVPSLFPSASASAIYGTPVAPLPPASTTAVSSIIRTVDWSPTNPFYVSPVPASASTQVPASAAIPESQTNIPIVPIPVLDSSASTPNVVVVQTPSFIPGVIPSSTPGVVPSFTPGIVPSLTPSVVPSPASSVPFGASSAGQSPPASSAPATTPSQPQSSEAGPSTPIATPSESPSSAAVPSTLLTATVPSSPSQSSIIPINTASFSRVPAYTPPSLTRTSTRATSTSSANVANASPSSSGNGGAQGTDVPPAPSAAGASRGKEKVWWVAFAAVVGISVVV